MHEVSGILGNEYVSGYSEQNQTSTDGNKTITPVGTKFHTNFQQPSPFASKSASAPLTFSHLIYVLLHVNYTRIKFKT